jgi:hypothetical protein
MCNFAEYMKKHILLTILTITALAACKQTTKVQRPAFGLVQSILADTTGLRDMAAWAGQKGASGSIALFGEAEEVKALARRYKDVDLMDNVDGREKRDSLPDFSGEIILGIGDSYNAPYSHFLAEGGSLDSLREVAIFGALQAWDTTRRREPAKILVFTSTLQSQYGFTDVDTLQQLTGGKCRLLSPVGLVLNQAFGKGAVNAAVWTSPALKEAKIWEQAFARQNRPGKHMAVFSSDPSLDVRGQFRDILRQYQVSGLPLEALIVDSYQIDLGTLESELRIIRTAATEEDAAFDKMMAPQFKFYEPADALIRATLGILREENLFAHRIARPAVKLYEYVPELY